MRLIGVGAHQAHVARRVHERDHLDQVDRARSEHRRDGEGEHGGDEDPHHPVGRRLDPRLGPLRLLDRADLAAPRYVRFVREAYVLMMVEVMEAMAAGLPVVLTDKDQMGVIKPVNLIEDYQEVFYKDMIKPILEGKKVPWDHFLPIVPAGTSRYRDMSYISAQLPVYDASKCIACGICTASCPDSALISTITDRPVDTVIIIGPSHYVAFRGASVYAEGAWRTPLGVVKVPT